MSLSVMNKITRRQALKQTAIAAAATLVVPMAHAAETAPPFSLPPLGYAADALEPHIDAQTMLIHHGKHHAAYVAGLNKAVADAPSLAGKSLDQLLANLADVPEKVRGAVRNHGGGHANHALFWRLLKKNGGKPSGELLKAIEKAFGSSTACQEKITEAALKQFGSGWAWLTVDSTGQLKVEGTANQDSPISSGRTPLLGIDVWEHAYYLKYQNRRADYVTAIFNVIDWDVVAENYLAATRK